jgi:alpha-glucosidase
MTHIPGSWHKNAIIYQIYPRSFKDQSGDGVGDLHGLISKLDYLRGKSDSLGVDAIWISPIYPSPMADFGYDVADYTGIDPLFGTMEDFRELLDESHRRGLKVMMDFVPNHSSDEHPWFLESSSSLDNPKRDWYVWKDPAPDGGPPNNWLACFGGSSWEFSEKTGQYYLHSFLVKQPDLNWANPELREAMKDAMRFWLDMGVDGFRVDAIDFLSKDPQFRNEPLNHYKDDEPDRLKYDVLHHKYSREAARLYEYLSEMANVIGEYDDRFMITEGHPTHSDRVEGYLEHYKNVHHQLASPFNFEGIFMPWKATNFKHFIDAFQAVMKPGYTPIYCLGNHDETRLATRIGTEAARTAAMMLMTLPGQAFIYNGDELGMTDTKIARDQIRDPQSVHGPTRDPERTPMQWDASPYAGFSTAETWLPVNKNHKTLNAEAQTMDPDSLLNLYKRLIRLRKKHTALIHGTYLPVECEDGIFAYIRETDEESMLILLNFTDTTRHVTGPEISGEILATSDMQRTDEIAEGGLTMQPHEGLILLRSA